MGLAETTGYVGGEAERMALLQSWANWINPTVDYTVIKGLWLHASQHRNGLPGEERDGQGKRDFKETTTTKEKHLVVAYLRLLRLRVIVICFCSVNQFIAC